MKRARLAAPLLAACWLASAALAQTEPALDPAALATLRRMAETLRGLPSLRVEAQVEYDALQRDGQTLEFGSTREIAVRRPDRIRAVATGRSGAERSLQYDGRQVTVEEYLMTAQGLRRLGSGRVQAGGGTKQLRPRFEQQGWITPVTR